MRRTIAGLLFLGILCPGICRGGTMTIYQGALGGTGNGYIQSNTCQANSPSVPCTLSNAVTAGNTILISCDGEGAAPTISTDTRSNTYTTPTGAAQTAQGGLDNYNVFVATNAAAGSTTVTCTSPGATKGQVIVSEYASTMTAGGYDVFSASNPVAGNSLASVTSGSATTTAPNELMFETCVSYNSTISGPSGTVRQNFVFDRYQMTQDATVTTPSSYASTFTTATGNAWGCIELAFKSVYSGTVIFH
jgi:hypothetical protein